MPTSIFFTDALGIGIGSYHLNSSLIWNYAFPINLLLFTTINHLEFFIFIIQLLLLEYYNAIKGEHILIWINNQTANSWLRKQLRSDIFTNWLFTILESLLLQVNFSIWGSYLSSNLNFIADILS